MTYSRLASPYQTQAVLDRFGLAAKHRLGQNFLVDDAVIGRILGLAELGPTDVVLEVGPGIGTLTVALLPRARAVVAVEADPSLAPVLAETCADDSERLALVVGDALRVAPEELAVAAAGAAGVPAGESAPTKLVSNLPYQVAATVILRLLGAMPSLGRAVVMVQAEVADRICAEPGTRAYGAYTAKLALLARPTGRFEVGPQSFRPAPHVDSAVVRLDRAPARDPATGAPLDDARVARVARVVDAAFSQRRKKLANSLAAGLRAGGAGRGDGGAGAAGGAAAPMGKPQVVAALETCGIDPGCRAETLSPADFVRLEAALAEVCEGAA